MVNFFPRNKFGVFLYKKKEWSNIKKESKYLIITKLCKGDKSDTSA